MNSEPLYQSQQVKCTLSNIIVQFFLLKEYKSCIMSWFLNVNINNKFEWNKMKKITFVGKNTSDMSKKPTYIAIILNFNTLYSRNLLSYRMYINIYGRRVL